MTLRKFIEKLNEAPESQKEKIVKYCGEWEAEFDFIELMDFEECVLLMLR